MTPELVTSIVSFLLNSAVLSSFIIAQVLPVQCNYPAAVPHVGECLTVADTVPTPAPGQGVYYVTSATYQGATQYGRKATAGHLSGRDPAVLPGCVP